MRCQNFSCVFFRFVTKHACDGETGGHNYDPQDRVSIAASHGENTVAYRVWFEILSPLERLKLDEIFNKTYIKISNTPSACCVRQFMSEW